MGTYQLLGRVANVPMPSCQQPHSWYWGGRASSRVARNVLLLQLLDVRAFKGIVLSLSYLVGGGRLGAGSRGLGTGLDLGGLLFGRLGDGGLGSWSSHVEEMA